MHNAKYTIKEETVGSIHESTVLLPVTQRQNWETFFRSIRESTLRSVSQFRLYAFALKNHQRDAKNTQFLTCRILRRFLGRFLVHLAQKRVR